MQSDFNDQLGKFQLFCDFLKILVKTLKALLQSVVNVLGNEKKSKTL